MINTYVIEFSIIKVKIKDIKVKLKPNFIVKTMTGFKSMETCLKSFQKNVLGGASVSDLKLLQLKTSKLLHVWGKHV